jgi:hypothetical protein
MDTFTTRNAHPAGGLRHHSAQGFCTVCGTAWPCWSGLSDEAGRAAPGGSGPPRVVAAGVRPW